MAYVKSFIPNQSHLFGLAGGDLENLDSICKVTAEDINWFYIC